MYGPFGLLNQPVNPWFDPQKMDPSRVPLGLLSQQPDAPAPGAMPAGPAPMQPQQPPAGPPMQLPSAAPAESAQPQGGLLAGFDGLLNKLGNVYGQGGQGDGLINLGLAIASPGNMAQNLSRANEANTRSRMMNWQIGQQQQKAQGQNETAKLLSQRLGITPEQAMGVIQSGGAAQLFQQAFTSPEQFKTETDAAGNIWQINTRNNERKLLNEAQKPQLVDMPTATGMQKAWVAPGSSTGVAIGAPSSVDQETLAKERAKAQVKDEQDKLNKEKATETVMPFIDRAEKAYSTLARLNAIGPISASGTSRFMGGVFGTEAEKARQDFEAAAKELELMKAQISMKGQGQITESERRILQLTLPRLDAADPKTGMETLRMLRQQFMKNAGAATPAPPQPAKRFRYNPQTGALE